MESLALQKLRHPPRSNFSRSIASTHARPAFETLNNVSRTKVQTMKKLSKVLAFGLIVAAVALTTRAQNATTTQMRLEHAEVPLYPEPAHTANIFGTVEVRVTVKDGAVVNAEVISGPPILSQATAENIQGWHFAYHVSDTFTTKFVYQLADVGDVANPRVELQLPYLVTITGVRVRLASNNGGKVGTTTANKGATASAKGAAPDSRAVVLLAPP